LSSDALEEFEDAKEVIRKFKSKDRQYIHLISLKTACKIYCHYQTQTSLVHVVAYVFSWFTKFHGFMILTGTTKIGIQQIKLSIHTSEKNYENFIKHHEPHKNGLSSDALEG
jgi:hypothetical protein